MIISHITPFLPRTTKSLLMKWGLIPPIAAIIVEMADDEVYDPWFSPYSYWQICPQEYDLEGMYGSLPMPPIAV